MIMLFKCVLIICLTIYKNEASETEETERSVVHVEAKDRLYLTCQDVNITCKIQPVIETPESVVWFLNGTNITSSHSFLKENKDCKPNYCSLLRITCINKSHNGNYTCRFQTEENTSYDSVNYFWLDVHEPIKVVNHSLNHRVPLNPSGDTNLMCLFEGQNIRNVSWSKLDNEDVIVLPNSHHKEEKIEDKRIKSTLIIKGVGRDKNGTYICGANDDKMNVTENVPLYVLDVPHITLHTVTATGSQKVFMNWTIDDGNSPIDHYIVQYRKNGTDWQYYDTSINGVNTSCIIRKLEPNTTYTFRISARNEIGEKVSNESYPVTTLATDPNFVPEVSIKGIGPSSINIAWTYPPVELRNHVHYFKLLMTKNDLKKEAFVNADSYLTYAFTNLQSASTYNFQVTACNDYTKECGNWSAIVSGTTLDGVAGAPENVTMNCKYDNISNTGTVWTSWLPPKIPNGEIVHYIATIQGSASFINEHGRNDIITYGPKTKTIKNDTYIASFPSLPPNTNYTITVSAVTRTRDAGEIALRHCVMPPTVPDRENLLKFDWDKVEEKGQYLFRLLKPKLSERNGAICCYRVFVVKLKPQQSVQQLPAPEQNPVFSYEYVHHEADGGTYIADVFDKEFATREVYVGDEHIANSTKCTKCPIAIKRAPTPTPTTTTTTTVTSTTSAPISTASAVNIAVASDQQPNPSHYSSAKLLADANIFMSDSSNEIATSMETAIVAAAKDEVTPFDGPLHDDSNYTGFVQLIVFGKDGFIPAYSSYFTILKPGPPSLDEAEATEFSAILFQILCGIIAISIMMLAAFCLLQHYTKQVAEAQGVEMTLRNSFRHLCRSLRGSHVPVSSNPPDVLPISKIALLTTFAELAKDSDYGFEQEFEMLPDRFTDRTTKASEARENTSKNRYPDIKAYDQTRVKLSQIDGILGSDYINANFVMSYKERKKFICAQGPMENTVCDFWRMIWEQHLELVLMLTNLEEYSKTKCAKYWPDKEEEKKTYSDITIHYVNERRYSDYVVRELKMVRTTAQNRDPEERIIFQYHFLMWKDFQAPEHPSGILKFIWRINEAYSLEKGPILVHCSAGVGRTGTLVAIDSLLQQLDNEGQVLIFNTICDLRHQRNFLVQSLKQYIFVYRALVEYAHFGNTEIRANSLKLTVEKLKRSANGKLKTRMEEEYDKLSFTISTHEQKSTSVGSAPENAVKNRTASIIPYDKNRVILTPIPGREHSTYINASFIEGYDNSESFIITQDPIIDVTVTDFWRMVSELNISTVVMLSSTTSPDGQKKTGRYWPDDEAAYGNVNVKHIQSESCPYYTKREFYVNNVKTDENLVLTQFQYNGWPTVEGEVPQVTRGLIELMDHATTLNENTNSAGPILVHCEQGGDRSSMFVALCILAQQLKVERRVDVVTTTRKLRSQRQGMLTSFAQYEFLYRAILNYVDLHHLFDAEPN